jgi:hypothetical protein
MPEDLFEASRMPYPRTTHPVEFSRLQYRRKMSLLEKKTVPSLS